jgi:hypothetical protein
VHAAFIPHWDVSAFTASTPVVAQPFRQGIVPKSMEMGNTRNRKLIFMVVHLFEIPFLPGRPHIT